MQKSLADAVVGSLEARVTATGRPGAGLAECPLSAVTAKDGGIDHCSCWPFTYTCQHPQDPLHFAVWSMAASHLMEHRADSWLAGEWVTVDPLRALKLYTQDLCHEVQLRNPCTHARDWRE